MVLLQQAPTAKQPACHTSYSMFSCHAYCQICHQYHYVYFCGVSACWHLDLGKDTTSRYLALSGKPTIVIILIFITVLAVYVLTKLHTGSKQTLQAFQLGYSPEQLHAIQYFSIPLQGVQPMQPAKMVHAQQHTSIFA